MNKKYRQPGYHDDDQAKAGSSPSSRGPQATPEGPRGRGLGSPTQESFRCRDCGREVAATDRDKEGSVGLEATCRGCGADLHSCVHCSHFDPSARFECRQPVVERLTNKTRRNSCKSFAPRLTVTHASQKKSSTQSTATSAKAAFDALFD